MRFASLLIPKFSLQAALREHALSADSANLPADDSQAAPQGAAHTSAPSNQTTAWPSQIERQRRCSLDGGLETAAPSENPPRSTSSCDPQFEKPAGLIDEREKKPVILELNHAAESAGVVAGMTPSQALARCLELLILPRCLQQELSVQEILLERAFTLSPYVEETAPGLCTVQFFDHRDRSDEISRALTELRSCQIIASAGVGPDADVSYLAAHRARPLLVVNDSREFLAPLPLEVLLSNLADVRSA